MKRSLLVFVLLSAPALAAPGSPKLLDCNLGFGPVAQVVVEQGAQGLSYGFLTSTGRWLKDLELDEDLWRNHEVTFSYRGDRIELASEDGRSWAYRVFAEGSRRASIIGTADCE